MQDTELQEQIKKRRTFAIISHPDAGKTTLTEKLLLYGGAIRLAGTVKGRKAQKFAVSDWMEIEKQRGISVTSSVMQFEYDGCCINILDTPGHQDFSEDTYRTLMAADSAVMLIDAAKGVEEQTRKLFQVCRQRHIPVFTFVNKIDRYGKDPFELMDELEKVLGIRSYPMNWPVGINGDYQGVYNRQLKQVELFEADGSHGSDIIKSTVGDLTDETFAQLLPPDIYKQLCHDKADQAAARKRKYPRQHHIFDDAQVDSGKPLCRADAHNGGCFGVRRAHRNAEQRRLADNHSNRLR